MTCQSSSKTILTESILIKDSLQIILDEKTFNNNKPFSDYSTRLCTGSNHRRSTNRIQRINEGTVYVSNGNRCSGNEAVNIGQ